MDADGQQPAPTLASICASCAEAIGVTGAGVVMMVGKLEQGIVCHSDSTSAVLEELQFTYGEGPTMDTHRFGRPVLVPDLGDPEEIRWPAFTPAALDAGVRAVSGFPLNIGAARLGVLHVYRMRAGPLADAEHSTALEMADRITHAILDIQAHAPPGLLGRELANTGMHRLEVHQASGMISAQLEVGVDQALVRMRAHAYANGLLLLDLARDVIGRRVRFEEEPVRAHEDGIGYDR